MHVDVSVPLWAFWDVYGNTQKLRLIGSTLEGVEVFEDSAASQENDRNNLAMTDVVGISHNSSECPPLPPRSRSTHNIGAQSSSQSR